jgi:tRNA-dihydrouridine synthase
LLEGDDATLPNLSQRFETMTKYIKLSVKFFGENRAIRMMRSQLGWFVKGMRYSSRFRESIKRLSTEEETLSLVREYQTQIERFEIYTTQ